MKKKKLEAKLTKTKKKLAKTRTELDAMLAIIDKSGMPKASEKPAVGSKAKPAKAPPAKKPSNPAKTANTLKSKKAIPNAKSSS